MVTSAIRCSIARTTPFSPFSKCVPYEVRTCMWGRGVSARLRNNNRDQRAGK
jgi:hypothetical protein